MRLLPLLVLLAPLAGCLDAPGETSPEGDDGRPATPRHLSGAFTGDATQDDVAEAQRLAAAEGGDMAILESFPLQFSVAGLDAEGCARLRGALLGQPWVARVGECREPAASDDPDAPTGSGP